MAEFNSGVHFFRFRSKLPFLGKFGPKDLNCHFKVKLHTYNSGQSIFFSLSKLGPKCQNCQFKGYICYIFASLFLGLKESTCQMKKSVFLFHFKTYFRSCENQILELYIFKFHDVIKYISIKQEIHFTE